MVRAGSKTDEFAPQGLSNIAWDFATSSACEQTLFESAALAAEKRILELSFQNLANISQTFATAQARSMPLFAAVATRVSETEIDIEQEQGLANLAWCFGKVQLRSEVFLDAIIAKLEVLQFTVQGVANAAQALAELQCQSTIMRNLLQSAVERLKLIDVAKEVETDDLPSVKAVLSLAHALAFWDLLTSEAYQQLETTLRSLASRMDSDKPAVASFATDIEAQRWLIQPHTNPDVCFFMRLEA
ncbi:unnamed protein product [Durusdinium trenchii]|uniref:Uncharacterized protein n=2 Tax=Durusdinium trenchii TaxID=1381693 RepID=A0ABP0SLA4_9DINO